ncbi:MAG: DUF547 domain-containing protein [Candidatus Latescibacteria bacterium]|nr:DUF547 domain-containing protein [Candidatus Latescibacterota bacterium]
MFRTLLKISSAFVLAGCTNTIVPIAPDNSTPASQVFRHDLFDRLLQRAVDDSGRVDYSALQTQADDLEAYYYLISLYSPDSHPDLFPTPANELAYWINAYNAATLKTVLTHYPIAGVTDVKPPAIFFFFPERSGFFYFQRVILGGEKISLYDLEKDLVLKRYPEPRLHFTLNCASRGCPRLPNRAFTAAELDQQLERETRRFLGEQRNLHIDREAGILRLSSIFEWYESDFTEPLKENRANPTLIDYIAPYLSSEDAALLQTRDFEIKFIPYDWGLNDQAAY